MREPEPGIYVPDEIEESLPATIYLLALPDGQPEVQRGPRSIPVMFVYSDFEVLVRCCGLGQPWWRVDQPELYRVMRQLRIAQVAVNMPPAPEPRYPEPDVFEADELPELPPMVDESDGVWVPTRPYRPSDRRVVAELQPNEQDQPFLPAYTSHAMLVHGCGPHQAAVQIATERLGEFANRVGAIGVLFNPILEDKVRHAQQVRR